MESTAPTAEEQAEFEALMVEFKAFIDEQKAEWIPENRHRGSRWDGTGDVYEVMRPEERAKVHAILDRWAEYITPIAERWLQKRGWMVIWPENNSKPAQYRRLDS